MKIETNLDEKNIEKCVICLDKTGVEKETDIKYRPLYIEGGGQLCGDCHNKIYKKREDTNLR